jgi:hypothetical protein
MTIKDLREKIKQLAARRQFKQEESNPEEFTPLTKEWYKRQWLDKSPEQRYQDKKNQTFEHDSCSYWKYLETYQSLYKKPDPKTGDCVAAYWAARNAAEVRFNELYPNEDDKGCTITSCVKECRYYPDYGRIEDSEVESWYE